MTKARYMFPPQQKSCHVTKIPINPSIKNPIAPFKQTKHQVQNRSSLPSIVLQMTSAIDCLSMIDFCLAFLDTR